ncbi:hypothetical protein [Microcystis aeruginosa]|uniref:hypothetical protein n=1 Tax=Microcystis aeruginosa TaxID=1126 RepID=UPI00132FCFC1|nr:hypothetical protein [Microcystis aeruginosa]
MHILPILRKLSRSINRQPVKCRRQEIIFIYFSHTLHPTPYTLHPTPYTLHPTPHTLHPTPQSLGLVYVSRGEGCDKLIKERLSPSNYGGVTR